MLLVIIAWEIFSNLPPPKKKNIWSPLMFLKKVSWYTPPEENTNFHILTSGDFELYTIILIFFSHLGTGSTLVILRT